jgi:adenylate cyclase
MEETKSIKSEGRAKAPKQTRSKSGSELQKLRKDNAALRAELDDLTLLYEATIEHSEAIEDQLAGQTAKLEVLSGKLSKYLSPQVYKSIFEGRQEVKIASTRKKLTVFFSDIAEFTETADRLESEELTALLNHYLTEMSNIALKHGATIDKYVGDAILIFFGDPETKGVREDALACVRMAIEMQIRMSELQADWRKAGISKPLKCRMGIHTDYCTVGNFGSGDRLDYTIIGRGVNIASRLESLAAPGAITISFETYSQVKDHIVCRETGDASVKGIAYPITTFEVLREEMQEDFQSTDKLMDMSKQLEDLAFELPSEIGSKERESLVSSLKNALARLNEADRQIDQLWAFSSNRPML